jgi:hypothetical protein
MLLPEPYLAIEFMLFWSMFISNELGLNQPYGKLAGLPPTFISTFLFGLLVVLIGKAVR